MKRGQLNMGLDPETMLLGIELTLGYIDRGIKKFADYAKVMIDEVGNEYRPYLKMFYNGVRESPEAQESGLADEMTPYDEVRTFDVANFDKGHSDALATAEMVVQEQEVNRQADEAKEKLIEQRNEQRRKEDEQSKTAVGREPDRRALPDDIEWRRRRSDGVQQKENSPGSVKGQAFVSDYRISRDAGIS